MFVLDASIVFAVFFKDENSAYAYAVMNSLNITPAFVPAMRHFEIPNVFIVGERRKRCTREQSDSFLAYLTILPLVTEPVPAIYILQAIIELARKHDLSAYDATYLELAIRNHIPLASLDKPLNAAAVSEGVPHYQP